MHDLGPNSLEYSPMLNEIFGNPQPANLAGEFGQHEYEMHEAGMHEFQESPLHEAEYANHEYESGELHEAAYGAGHEVAHEVNHELHEAGGLSHEDEIALAAELMNVQSEAELQQFIGKLVRRAGRFLRTPTGQILTGALRQVARKALPIVAKAAGTALGGPVGGLAAGYLANAAGKALGLEVSGMTQEEANFAGARQFVRFAENAARRAAAAAARTGGVNPTAIARGAVTQAARQFAPGLLGPRFGTIPAPQMPSRGANRGVWVRRGSAIVIYGV